ncbi:HAMP domain-containing sensor histidine kinase [Flavihumibacter sp. ZG627]|uniref:sensor histidine kinase n=1 Tax=Flavihumibacter sp. ZG627 TaxID=1463156 RepID=UPI00057E7F51|nr:HAMP domain-containing sensor histidine kinase [Flavihumibacter sp. ZG627]KIC90283.1 hypothetical protein HY58_09920 [Flavihumibacter sp. ZG627]
MKLLSKSLRGYLVYSIIVLLISIPAFYYQINAIVAEDVDEDLMARRDSMIPKMENAIANNSLEMLLAFEQDFHLESVLSLQRDTLYTIMEYNDVSKENTPHRIMESSVMINGKPYRLKLKNSLLDNDNIIASIVLVQSVLMVIIIAGILIITHYMSKRVWRPFYATLRKLREYKIETEKSIEIEKTDVDEFSDLNQTINNLTDRSHRVYLSQKEFTENASHEMQTPLAVFHSKVELLMQTSPLTNEQAELITALSQAAQRMKRLNKMLLLLAKIENNQFTEIEIINIDLTLQKIVKQYGNALSQKNISLHTRILSDNSIEANQILIDILMGNLLSNAIRHNMTGGEINIIIDNSGFVITNTGRVAALDASRLFQRFQKQSTDLNSLGLGLEMTKRICNLYNAKIHYSFDDGKHSFRVNFKDF